jgi:asparagine synthase (glutamine-hydrolysing)
MAMAHGVEERYPFLDHRVVEIAANFPPVLKTKVLDQKYVLKHAAVSLIPETILKRHEPPCRAPDAKSLAPAGGYLEEMLPLEKIRRGGIFETEQVSGLAAKLRRRHANGTKDRLALLGVMSPEILVGVSSIGGKKG